MGKIRKTQRRTRKRNDSRQKGGAGWEMTDNERFAWFNFPGSDVNPQSAWENFLKQQPGLSSRIKASNLEVAKLEKEKLRGDKSLKPYGGKRIKGKRSRRTKRKRSSRRNKK